jgi:Na+/proline symporter
MTTITIIILVFFALVILYLGWAHGDSSTAEAFNMGGREAGWIKVAFGAFTVVGAGEFVGVTAYAKDFGLYSFSLFLGIALGAIIIATCGRAAFADSQTFTFSSLPDYVAHYYGRCASLLVSLVSIAALGALLLIQFSLGGAILASFLDVHLAWAIGAIAAVVIGYVCVGGLKAILFTDVVQGTAMLLFLLSIVTSLYITGGGGELPQLFPPLIIDGDASGLYFCIVLFFSGLAAVSGGADLWQRLFCASTFKHARRGFFLSAALYLVFGALLMILAVHILGTVNPQTPEETGLAFITYFTDHISPFWLGIAVIGIFAGVISTADAELLVISILSSCEMNRYGLNKEVDSADTKWIVLGFGIAAAIGGYFAAGKLEEVFTILLFLLLITGGVAWICLLRKGSKLSVTVGLVLSIVIFVAEWVTGYLFSAMWSLLVPVPLLASLLIKGVPNNE